MSLFRRRRTIEAVTPEPEDTPHELVVRYEATLRERAEKTRAAKDLIGRAEQEVAELLAAARTQAKAVGMRRASEHTATAEAKAQEMQERAEREAKRLLNRTSEHRDDDVGWLLARVLPAESDEPRVQG